MWYERYMICDVCGKTQRKTATTIPLDNLGNDLNSFQEKRFINNKFHKCENPTVTYTEWKLAEYCYKKE